jgi:hypothetical protein
MHFNYALLATDFEPEAMSRARVFASAELLCNTILNETHHRGRNPSYMPRRGWGARVDHASALEGRGQRRVVRFGSEVGTTLVCDFVTESSYRAETFTWRVLRRLSASFSFETSGRTAQ